MSEATILIIEDDATLLRGLEDNFLSRGYRVETARDGREGLDAALDSPPDLVLLDIMLPKINGYEVCRLIREHRSEMPIIMLTAKGQEEDIIRGLELGADDYVTKPFSIRELLARVKAFLRRGQVAATEVYRFGDCRLDLASHRLCPSGKRAKRVRRAGWWPGGRADGGEDARRWLPGHSGWFRGANVRHVLAARWDTGQVGAVSWRASNRRARRPPAGPRPSAPGESVTRYFDRDASKSCRSALSSSSQMNPTRSFLSMSRHQAISSLAGRPHFWKAWMTTFRHSSMSSVINPSSLISTW